MKCEAISGVHVTDRFGNCDLAPYDRGGIFEAKDWNWEDFCEPCAWALSDYQSGSKLLTQTVRSTSA
jgi:hypothetical protein